MSHQQLLQNITSSRLHQAVQTRKKHARKYISGIEFGGVTYFYLKESWPKPGVVFRLQEDFVWDVFDVIAGSARPTDKQRISVSIYISHDIKADVIALPFSMLGATSIIATYPVRNFSSQHLTL